MLNELQDRFREAGASFVALSPNTTAHSRELATAQRWTFPLLRDEGNAVAARFNALNRVSGELRKLYLGWGIDLPLANGEASWTLPIPGSYVIDRDGIIRFASADADYTRRPEPEETVELLSTVS